MQRNQNVTDTTCTLRCIRGIVPITCDELFKAIAENKDKNKVSQ